MGGTPERGLVVGGTAWTARIDPVFVEGGEQDMLRLIPELALSATYH